MAPRFIYTEYILFLLQVQALRLSLNQWVLTQINSKLRIPDLTHCLIPIAKSSSD